MATHSFIGVVVNPQDNGKTISPSLELLGKEIFTWLDKPEFHDTVIEETTKVIRIYHHFDGNPDGVGKTLLDEFNSYEKAINLIAFGDASSIIGTNALFYNSWREGEDWKHTKPRQYTSEQAYEESCDEDYAYLFKDGKWYVKNCWSEEDTDWKAVEEVIEK
jgi:hypothetical protein